MASKGKQITDHILKQYTAFIKSISTDLSKKGHLSTKQMKELMADGRIILDLQDRFVILTATKDRSKKQQEVKFEFVVRKK